MPKQTQILKQMKREESQLKKPFLDEHELEEIGIIKKDSLDYSIPVKITIWDYGYFYHTSGIVVKVDMLEKKILILTDLEEKCVDIEKMTMVSKL
ncbi:YolD-like family protein [Bacillus sp. CGMCC 1.16607]|uniref:YolD-like family protein n=1 Tax=Bacillus sp. CGMCC 1.16607 TaxID=3351842 RepID=UPI0036289819